MQYTTGRTAADHNKFMPTEACLKLKLQLINLPPFLQKKRTGLEGLVCNISIPDSEYSVCNYLVLQV